MNDFAAREMGKFTFADGPGCGRFFLFSFTSFLSSRFHNSTISTVPSSFVPEIKVMQLTKPYNLFHST